MLLRKDGRDEQASEQLDILTKECQQLLDENPNQAELQAIMGKALFDGRSFAKAAEHFKKAVELQPGDLDNCIYLIQTFELSGQREPAVQAAQNAIEYFTAQGREKDAETITKYIQQILSRNTYLQRDKK
jgi:uncharacterized protein HemY